MKWWLIAWREIRWEVFLDRASLLRTGVFVVIPLFFVVSNRGLPQGPAGDVTLIGLALQSVFFPALSGVALIAATFSAEKENGTLVPLLAAPIRDFDIVLGKLVGMVVPVMVACVVTLSAAIFAGLGFVASQLGEGWPLLALGVGLVVLDILALELARRVWQREEVIGRV